VVLILFLIKLTKGGEEKKRKEKRDRCFESINIIFNKINNLIFIIRKEKTKVMISFFRNPPTLVMIPEL